MATERSYRVVPQRLAGECRLGSAPAAQDDGSGTSPSAGARSGGRAPARSRDAARVLSRLPPVRTGINGGGTDDGGSRGPRLRQALPAPDVGPAPCRPDG